MNDNWSRLLQGPLTLYESRLLRFSPRQKETFLSLFRLDASRPLRILEIGCGPGALAQRLKEWYPLSEVTGLDRDSTFIEWARARVSGVTFVEGDAGALPFGDGTFDVTVSYTVSEHIDPDRFFPEQLRVLAPGGVCLTLSARPGITRRAPCLAPGKEECDFWDSLAPYDDTMERLGVGRYAAAEDELPRRMEGCGFTRVSTGYAVSALTPDDPLTDRETALAILAAERHAEEESLLSARATLPGRVSAESLRRMLNLASARHSLRLSQYLRGEKQWDTQVSLTLAVRGVKPSPA